MYGIINIEVFLLAAILLNLTPGTDTMYIISRSVSQGRAAGIFSALGISSGIVVHTLLAAFGLSIIITQSIFLFTLIKIIGAIYLAYLGLQMILSKKTEKNRDNLVRTSYRTIFFQGMITNVTNPKVALFFLAFLPQFVETNAGVSSPVPFLLLGLLFTFTGTIWCIITAWISSMATNKLRTNSKVQPILQRLTGVVFIGMGLSLLQTKAS